MTVFFQIVTETFLLNLVALFRVKKSDFGVFKWFLSYTHKCIKKKTINWLFEKRFKLETKKDFWFKF